LIQSSGQSGAVPAISEELLQQQRPAIEHHNEHAANALPKE
jgi:hypothetical protein